MKLNKHEQAFVNFLAKIIGLLVFIVIYIVKLIVKILYKLKKQIFKLTLLMFAIYLPLYCFQPIAHAPKANATLDEFNIVGQPTTEKEQIIAYIKEVFGKDADEALLIAKCESGIRAEAYNTNTNGSVDVGVFQINSVHGVRAKWLTNWKVNVEVAHQLFTEQGHWNAWVCARKVL